MNWKKILTKSEHKLFRKLNTPKKIQDYLESLPINFEKRGETCLSPHLVIQKGTAHCIEGAMLAAAILWFHGQKPLLLDLTTVDKDYDHVVTLFRLDSHWGAISKTNHAVLRYREPVYKTVRELAMSYFHEYFWKDGTKTMRGFSKPFDLRKYGVDWIVSEKSSWVIPDDLDASPHYKILTLPMTRNLRKADDVEIKAGEIVQWKK